MFRVELYTDGAYWLPIEGSERNTLAAGEDALREACKVYGVDNVRLVERKSTKAVAQLEGN